MKRLILLLWLLFPLICLGTSFTEFYVQPTGNNLNAGSTTDNNAIYTGTAGNWTNATGVWFKSGENLSAISVGMWASVYPDATTPNAVFVGRVTAVDDGADTITVSLTAKAGTAPANDEASPGVTSIKIGGAWAGPNTNVASSSSGFPIQFAATTMTNTSGNCACINFLAGTYNITNALTIANAGPIWMAGYTTTPRDGGKAIIDGGTTAVAYIPLTINGSGWVFSDITWSHNGAAGNQTGPVASSGGAEFYRCLFKNMGRSGAQSSAASRFISCEACSNNVQNTASHGGFNSAAAGDVFKNCISHDNAGANSSGFVDSNIGQFINCISYRNGGAGFSGISAGWSLMNCDAYNNTGSGIDLSKTTLSGVAIQNCNLFKNGGFGITSSGSPLRAGMILNCMMGQGTCTNTSGNISTNITLGLQGGVITNNISLYTVDETPWVDPDNGNFTLKAAALSKSKGYGSFYQSEVNSPTNTVSYPDIGASQSASTNASSGGEHSHVFAQ